MVRSLFLFFAFLSLSFVPTPAAAEDLLVPDMAPTLEEALSRAQNGDRIVILPGEHRAAATIPEGLSVEIIGRDGAEQTTLKGDEGAIPLLSISRGTEPVTIRGITFDGVGRPNTYSLMAGKRKIVLEDCVFIRGAGVLLDSCSGTVKGCRFQECFDGMKMLGSTILVDGNRFENIQQYAITMRASGAEIVRNRFSKTSGAYIVIVGKRYYPVIGGSREKANVFGRSNYLYIANESRNPINAQFNYWGPILTSTMDRLGYPANLDEFQDQWDSDDRAAGMIDYRNWLASEEDALGGGSKTDAGGIMIVVVILLAVLYFILRSRKKPTAV